MVEHLDDEQNSGLHLTGNTVDSNSDSFTEKEPIALKVVTDKHEVMPEEIWDQSIFSIFPVSETIMSFTPPLFKSVRGIEFDHLFISAWRSEEWEAFEKWRKTKEIEVISGNNIELWLQEYLGLKRIYLVEVRRGVEAGADSKYYYFYHKRS